MKNSTEIKTNSKNIPTSAEFQKFTSVDTVLPAKYNSWQIKTAYSRIYDVALEKWSCILSFSNILWSHQGPLSGKKVKKTRNWQ
jgi:hypothetical protein